jgi:hypothetical protein
MKLLSSKNSFRPSDLRGRFCTDEMHVFRICLRSPMTSNISIAPFPIHSSMPSHIFDLIIKLQSTKLSHISNQAHTGIRCCKKCFINKFTHLKESNSVVRKIIEHTPSPSAPLRHIFRSEIEQNLFALPLQSVKQVMMSALSTRSLGLSFPDSLYKQSTII